jgi:glutamate/tyrosine decarboxylase-like PLP-dependent enzyme
MDGIKYTQQDQRLSTLNISAEDFRNAGHKLIDQLADFLHRMPSGKVTKGLTPSAIKKLIGNSSLPDKGRNAHMILQRAVDLLVENSLFNGHPKFLGYITSSPAPVGALGDLIASITNPNCGAFILSPVATEIELQSIQWIAELIGYKKNCGGIMVSGGNMANIVAIWAARKKMADWNIREEGLTERGQRFTLYATQQVHTWLHKTADLLGFGLNAIRWIPTDEQLRMDAVALNQQITRDKNEGYIPLAVIGTAGSVGFGVVDPLNEIAAICTKQNVWFHVDGAYGALAASLPEQQELFRGMDKADSIAVDPHKWLYCPIESGCTLVRDPNLLLDAFCFDPEYYEFNKAGNETPFNFLDAGPQNTRGFRALKVWLVLQQAGRDGITSMIREDIQLAKTLNEELSKEKSLQVFTDELSITTFRYVPVDLKDKNDNDEYLNKLNTELLQRLQKNGDLFVSNAVWNGKYALRSCIVNFRTSLKDIQEIPGIVIKCGEVVDREMRG